MSLPSPPICLAVTVLFSKPCHAIAVVHPFPLEVRLCQPLGCSAKMRGATGAILRAFVVFFWISWLGKFKKCS